MTRYTEESLVKATYTFGMLAYVSKRYIGLWKLNKDDIQVGKQISANVLLLYGTLAHIAV